MTIALSARNAVEDLHADGAFSDERAPALNRRLRNRAYEVMVAVQFLGESGRGEFLSNQAAQDGKTSDVIEPSAALRGAIRTAVRDFAEAEQLPAPVAEALEAAAVDGATDAFQVLRSLDELESARQVSYLARLIPSYWELPEIEPERRELLTGGQ